MSSPPGVLLREWRSRRRFSQLDLSLQAEVSAKHLSCIETGRAKPSPQMIVHLWEHLDVPLRERNESLLAAGFAPRYRDRSGEHGGDAEVQAAISQVLASHQYPAVAVDRDWNLVTSNAAAAIFLDEIPPSLLQPPVNVLRLSLRADGLAPRVVNFAEYAAHVLARTRRAVERTPSPTLEAVLADFGHLESEACGTQRPGISLPLELRTGAGVISMFSTITTFGSPRDATLDTLAIEAFYPTDPTSRELLSREIA